MADPYRESAKCPVDHERIVDEAFDAGVKHQKQQGRVSAMNDWISSDGGKAIIAIGVVGFFLVVVLFIARSWPKDPAPVPACTEFRVDTTTAGCVGGTVEPVGGYLVCKCPHKSGGE